MVQLEESPSMVLPLNALFLPWNLLQPNSVMCKTGHSHYTTAKVWFHVYVFHKFHSSGLLDAMVFEKMWGAKSHEPTWNENIDFSNKTVIVMVAPFHLI